MHLAECVPDRVSRPFSKYLRSAVPLLEAFDRIDWTSGDWTSVDWLSVDWSRGWPSLADLPLDESPSRASLAGRTGPSEVVAAYTKTMTIFGINEATPGPRWKALFDATWSSYHSWYQSEGMDARPDLGTAASMLTRHMPELISTYDAFVALADNDLAARMLTMWNVPGFAPACSQAVVTDPAPALCRNYDYSPELWERTVYSSAFTGRRVIGTGDCLWGLLDGMNDAGLVVSLTYGGAPGSAPGFAIPLVVRYVLEVATSVAEAREILRRLPIAMSYNLTVLDAAGTACTAYLGPDRPARFVDDVATTNHQGGTPEFPGHAAAFCSVTRLNRLSTVLAGEPSPRELAAAFLRRPLYNDEYSRSFGTLYTALYRPRDGVVEYIWPDRTWSRTFDDPDATVDVTLRGR
jgi:predicted choloylglycine hydrolase